MLYIAAGLDPVKNCIFYQSHVPAHPELAWILNCYTYMGEMNRMTQFKDKAAKHSDNINTGLFTYPVLMAADILMYDADYVPVGIHQKQHVELTRDIARRFNNIYKTDFFKETKPLLNNCSLICGLDGNKMGKSFNNDIKIADTEEVTAKKIMSAITDRSRMRKDDLGHPDDCEVAFKYWKIFGSEEEVNTIRCECEKGQRGCADCKRQLGAKVNEKFKEVRENRRYYEAHPEIVEKILNEGSARAREEAQKVLKEVRKFVRMY